MTNTYRINASFAVSKAQDAVTNWTLAVAKAKEIGTASDVAFCEGSLRACTEALAKVRKDIKDNWHAYL